MSLKTFRYLMAATLLLFVCSCSDDDDDDYVYPSVFTELVDISTDKDGIATSLTDDKDNAYSFSSNIHLTRIDSAATTRCIAMFTRNDNSKVTLYSYSSVIAPQPKSAKQFKNGVKTDPVYVDAIWRGAHYVNVSLRTLGKEGTQYLGLVEDSISTDAHGARHIYVSLYHDLNADFEAYSRTAYVSIPLRNYESNGMLQKGDSIVFSANIYNKGLLQWTVAY